ncbi:MAG: DNA gyrase inhibitor YacG [Holophagaceae bacterium]|nr:DNA gyrase inhibitor YacG [Holophagaceae bacterium]
MLTIRPCPYCRKPTAWEGNAWKPFCSERCRVRDLGAWSSESYRIPDKPEEGMGDGWNSESDPGDGSDR